MKCENIQLIEGDDRGILTTYEYDTQDKFSDAILIIPGGGYACVCSDREGDPIALAFASAGVKPFVLSYSVGRYAKYPQPLLEASMAMSYIRKNAKKYGINPDRVFVVGFSAGGHLAGSLGTNWHHKEVNDAIDIEFGSNRPTGMILCYPVLCYWEQTHLGTFYNAFGTDKPAQEQIDLCSLEKNVDDKTCPAFLMHTANDDCVDVRNSLRFANALTEHGISYEMHIYPEGPHGIALANEVTALAPHFIDKRIAEWTDLAVGWMKTAKF